MESHDLFWLAQAPWYNIYVFKWNELATYFDQSITSSNVPKILKRFAKE